MLPGRHIVEVDLTVEDNTLLTLGLICYSLIVSLTLKQLFVFNLGVFYLSMF